MSHNGGTERCTVLIANELKRRTDNNIFIVDISNKTDECYFDTDRNIEIIHLNSKNILNGIRQLKKVIKSRHIDAIVNVEAMLGIYSIPATVFTKTKNIIWEHGNFYQKQCASIDTVRAIEMELCDYYITLTERDKNNFKSHFKGKCKLEYIYNPIELPNEVIYKGNTKTILSVGLVREIKGYDMLVEVANQVLKKHTDWQWDVYGDTEAYPEYMKIIKNKISEYEISDRLIFRGTTKNIRECYKAADIMVMTSRMEGLPMTLLEAKSYKLPIVSFDIMTGPSEIVDDGINGYLVEPYNIEKMEESICKLIENEALRFKFSENSYIGIDRFNIDSILSQWIEILDR